MRRLPCHYCGKTPAGTIDHIQRRRHGGMAVKENCVPACEKCNRGREWMPPPQGCHHPFSALSGLKIAPREYPVPKFGELSIRPWWKFWFKP